MANIKTGLNYYTVDTDRYQDRRIKRLKKDFKCRGIAVYDYILCEIYRVQGCFLVWDANTAFDVAEYFGLEENTVQEVVKYCGSVGLFDKELLSRGIITSASIQRRYTEMCTHAKRKSVSIPESYRLIQEERAPDLIPASKGACQKPDNPPPSEIYSLTLDEEIAELEKDECWLDQLQVLHHMDISLLRSSLDDFRVQCLADGKDRHSSLQDAKQHFNAWLRIVNDKNKRKDDKVRPDSRNQRRGNLLKSDEEKTYGNSF